MADTNDGDQCGVCSVSLRQLAVCIFGLASKVFVVVTLYRDILPLHYCGGAGNPSKDNYYIYRVNEGL